MPDTVLGPKEQKMRNTKALMVNDTDNTAW